MERPHARRLSSFTCWLHVDLTVTPRCPLVRKIPAKNSCSPSLAQIPITHARPALPHHSRTCHQRGGAGEGGVSHLEDPPWVRGADRRGSRHVSHLLWGKRSLRIGKTGLSAVPDSTGACEDARTHTRGLLGNHRNRRSAARFIPSQPDLCHPAPNADSGSFATDGSERNQASN